jgi:hypothetical protein
MCERLFRASASSGVDGCESRPADAFGAVFTEGEPGSPVAPIEGVQRSTHRLHVLLRHRLFPQPGGFEGCLPIHESLVALDEPAAHREDAEGLPRDVDAAPSPTA